MVQYSTVQDFLLTTNPQFTALPLVTPCAPHTATPYPTRHNNTTNSGITQTKHLGCSTHQTSNQRRKKLPTKTQSVLMMVDMTKIRIIIYDV